MGLRRFWRKPSALLISGAYGLVLAFIGGTLASEPRKPNKEAPRGLGASQPPRRVLCRDGADRIRRAFWPVAMRADSLTVLSHDCF